MDRRLAGGVAAAHDDHVLAPAALGVGRHRGVVHARTGEPLDVLGVQCPPPRAGGHDDRAGERVLPVVEVEADEPLRTARELDRAVKAREHRVEAPRLQRRLAGELGAGDAGREPDVVLDPRARPGLTARSPRLGDQRAQPLGAAVDGRREARRPAAQHDDVEALAVDLRAQPQLAGDLRGRRIAQHGRVAHETGVSSRGICSQSSIAVLSSSVSTSYQRTGIRLRSSRSRTSNARRDPRGAMRRSTPWPPATCHSRRAIMVRRTSSASSGHDASVARSSGRSKAITSVGSSATHSAIAGLPVKVAMSPRKVPASATATQTSLPGLRSSTRTRPRAITRNGASRRPCAYSVSPGANERRVPCSASRSSFSTEIRGNMSSSPRSGKASARICAGVVPSIATVFRKGYQTGAPLPCRGRVAAGRSLRSMPMAGTLIARDVHKAYGDAPILAGVSVTVAPGDVLGVVGPNGAGKSTLLRLLAGLDRPDRGSVRMTAGTAGYLPQEPDRAPGERLHDSLARRTGVGEADARVHAATEAMAAHAPGAAERYAEAFERWLALGGADLVQRAEAVLRDLGLDPALLDLE